MGKIRLIGGHTWTYIDANPDGHTTLLCLHGFPDLSYGYRYQIGAWARLGFRVVVPDMLGYGGSDAPVDPSQYTTKRLSADLDALLNALGVAHAVVVGHDWGSFTAGRFALWYPQRVLALAIMSVPFTPPSRSLSSLEHIVKRAPNLGYQLFLASPEAAPTIEANLPYFLALTFTPAHAHVDFTARGILANRLSAPLPPASVAQMPSVLTPAERAVYVAAFRARGMTGPTNYYRTAKLRGEEEIKAGVANLTLPAVPVLSLHGERDPTVAPAALAAQRRTIPPERFTERALEGVGHWVLLAGVTAAAAASPDVAVGKISDPADPLAAWRAALNAGSWKNGTGDGGVVGRLVVEWLKDTGITSPRARL